MLVSVFMERHFWERVFCLLPGIEKRPLLEVVLYSTCITTMVILIVQGYVKENEWNMDETGIFWCGLLDRGRSFMGGCLMCSQSFKMLHNLSKRLQS